MLPQVVPNRKAEGHLPGQLVALDQSGVLFSGELLLELEIIVPETDGAHPRHADLGDQDVTIVETGPEASTEERRAVNDQASHRRSPSLLLMRLRGSFPYHLV